MVKLESLNTVSCSRVTAVALAVSTQRVISLCGLVLSLSGNTSRPILTGRKE